MLLAIYLDNVVPQDYGVRKHPLFCLKRKNTRNSNKIGDSDSEGVSPNEEIGDENYEQVD